MTTTCTDVDNVILWFRRDGVLRRLEALAPHRDRWSTQLTVSAFHKGFEAGLTTPDADCPYLPTHAAPNFMRGDNSPRDAWHDGYRDGARCRALLTEPERVPDVRAAEFRLLPTKLRERIDRAL